MTEGATVFHRTLVEALRPWALSPSAEQVSTLHSHFAAVIEANRTMNLTRITEPRDAAVKHYADSLALLHWAQAERVEITAILDIGTGAGFPAVPVAVMRPDWRVTAIDGTRKKTAFLTRCAAELNLANLEVHHAHGRHWTTQRRFDVVAMRAVAALAVCIEQAERFLAPGGHLVVYKTASVSEEERRQAGPVAAAAALTSSPACRPAGDFAYELSLGGKTLQRLLCVYRKSDRRAGKPVCSGKPVHRGKPSRR